jgi:homoserine O-acetyltransferase
MPGSSSSLHVPPPSGNDFPLGDFRTEGGAVIPHASLRYRIIGRGAAPGRGWILVFHDLIGSAELEQWWGPLIGPGRALDPERHRVLAANHLGSCFGSTGPRDWAERRRLPFPDLTPTDLARATTMLIEHLGIQQIALAVGPSLGGMVALEWARRATVAVDHLVVVAAPAVSSPQAIAWHTAQRMAIEADPAWERGQYPPGRGPSAGLAAARALALITQGSGPEFTGRFGRMGDWSHRRFAVERYLREEGNELISRVDAASYVALLRTMDLHDLGDLTRAARETARSVARVTGVGINTDMLVPPTEVRQWVRSYQEAGLDAEYRELSSIHGHHAYRVEFEQLAPMLAS